MSQNNMNLSALASLTARSETVEIQGQVFELSLPSREDRLEIMQECMKGIDGDDPAMVDVVRNNFNATIKAVKACCGLMDEDQAYRLLMYAGGETGDLGQKAQQMAGIKPSQAAMQAMAEGEIDGPS